LDLEGLTDEDLLERFLAGHEAAFALLVKRHEDRIFSLAWQMMGSRTDALDASQETFIAAFRKASSFRGDSAFGTWLYQVGINTCRDLLRKKKRLPVPHEELPEPPSPGPGPENAAALRVDLARALAGLPEDYRTAVSLHDLGGVPYGEIAAVTGVPVGTVKSRISRGRRLLAQRLEHPSPPVASKDVT